MFDHGKTVNPGLDARALVYGCYSRGAYEYYGNSEDTQRLMFLLTKPDPHRHNYFMHLPFFPESNPPWHRGDDLVHYTILGLRTFRGVGQDTSQIAHILFVQKSQTEDNPCCDGGGPSPRGHTLLGFWLQRDSVKEVFHQTIEETLNEREMLGDGTEYIVTSTVTYQESANRVRLETSKIRNEYDAPKNVTRWKPFPPDLTPV